MHISLLADYPDLEIFADHILINYMKNEETGYVLFPKESWNHFDNNKRCNNDLEGYNEKLHKFLRKNPNIWTFINKIKAEEVACSLKYIRLEKEILYKRERNIID